MTDNQQPLDTNSPLDERWTARDGPIARRVTAVVVGAGNRGENYASFALDFPSRHGSGLSCLVDVEIWGPIQ